MDKHEKNIDISNRKTSILEIDSELDKQLHQGFFLHEVLVKPDLGIVIRETERFHLAPKAMEVLVLLASRPDIVVTYEQILGVVWASSKASKSTVSHTISEIRQVLGDPKECPIMIQTIPRKGYRLKVTPTLLENSDADHLGLPSPGPFKLSWAMIKSSRLFKVSAAYILFSWIMLQAFAIIFPIFEFPDWGLKVATLGLVIGFIIVIIYYWFSEIDARKRLAKAKATKVTLIKQFIFDSIFVFGALGVIFLISSHLVEKIDEQVSNPGTTMDGSSGVNSNAVAVFPFSDSQHSDETSYYPATIQEELISYLSSSPQIKVTSLRSTNSMPQNSDINAIKLQLKARYLIEGTISYDQETLEITSRLIDTETGFQLWQDKLSGNKNQLLALNEELFRKVQNALLLLITGSSQENESLNRPTENFAAYDAYLQGKAAYQDDSSISSLKTAEKHFTKALSLDNQFVLAAAALCKTNLKMYTFSQTISEYQKAKQSCELTANYKQVSSELHLALGKLYLTNGEYHHAKEQFEEALHVDENNSEAMCDLATTYKHLEEPVKARQFYRKAIQSEPGFWYNYYEYGAFLFTTGNFKEAIIQFKKVNLLKDDMVSSYNALGASHMMLWQLDEAVVALNKAIELEPSALAFSNLATNYFYLQEFDVAATNYEKALHHAPDNYTYWGNLADAIRYQGSDIPKAQNAYNKALNLAKQNEKINPNDINLKAQISRYHSELNQCQMAADYQNSVLQTEHQDPQVFYDMAIVAKNCLSNVQMKSMLNKAVSMGVDPKMILADPQFLDYKEELIRLFNNDAPPITGT
ncbi:winged helix-turn-helix domain-containing tetratricopeptide repeat protein [Thalassotalea sp. PS06]|uniref:winged helix-turn-helix domain-containing tetratricopeptide repeat protein n=1 Tax=Thalassotalea sp. PS06 TaxID=2594005 RepID=UPI001164574C|nr:winged helix-turn-helix domain-containing protein [Thalassotalea sp. PS06]QDP01868.1 tetratricopeptide repeat protein [Thalassotalea sp. PS06]